MVDLVCGFGLYGIFLDIAAVVIVPCGGRKTESLVHTVRVIISFSGSHFTIKSVVFCVYWLSCVFQ